MSNSTAVKPPISFWFIAGLALVWNVLGSANFLTQLNQAQLAQMPDWMIALIENRPMWATTAFGASVFLGVIGSLLLLLRKSFAYYPYLISFIAVVVVLLPFLGVGTDRVAIPTQIWVSTLLSLAYAAFLVRYVRYSEKKKWIQ